MRAVEADKLVMKDLGDGTYLVDEDAIRNAPTFDAVPRSEYERVCRERDAAIADLKEVTNRDGSCYMCKYSGEYGCSNKEYIAVCSGKNNLWEWRGVKDNNVPTEEEQP